MARHIQAIKRKYKSLETAKQTSVKMNNRILKNTLTIPNPVRDAPIASAIVFNPISLMPMFCHPRIKLQAQ